MALSALEFKMSLAVQKICEKVGDTEYKTYCTNISTSGYDGRAKSAFWESVFDIISDMYKDKTNIGDPEGKEASATNIFSQEDIKGLIVVEENISLSSATGKLKYAEDLTGELYKIIDIFPNPDNPDQLEKFLRKIDTAYFRGIKGQNLVPNDTLYWYIVGDGIMFYPKANIDAIKNKVSVMYIKDIDVSSWDYGAAPNPNGDEKDLTDLFSVAFIYKAIELASQKIESEKERI